MCCSVKVRLSALTSIWSDWQLVNIHQYENNCVRNNETYNLIQVKLSFISVIVIQIWEICIRRILFCSA